MAASAFLSLHPFFEGGPINGRKQANAGFMRALLELDPFDEYHFFVDNPRQLAEQWARHDGLRALRRGAAVARGRLELLPALREQPYSVCHLSDPIDDYVSVACARNALAPRVFVLTAPNHTLSYARYARSFQAYLWDGWSPRDALGCNSSAAREVLRGCFTALGAKADQALPLLEVVPMGADLRRTSADARLRTELRQRLGLGEDAVLLLLFGRIAVADKMDIHPLLMAVRRVAAQYPRLELHLAVSGAMNGREPASEILPLLAKRFGLSLRLFPNPSVEEREALYAGADIFVSPSDNIQETFGLTLVEAMAAGLPVVASDWDGYRDIVAHGVTGLLVPTLAPADTPWLDMQTLFLFENQYHYLRGQSTCVDVPALAEAIARLALEPETRRAMGRKGREMAQRRFSWASVAEQWAILWERLAAAPLPAADAARLRASRHALALPFGRIFAGYATAHLDAGMRVAATDMAALFLHGELPWEALDNFRYGFPQEDVRPLLVRARRPVTAGELLQRSGLDSETCERLLLWCLKHDLLARV